ncbi:complex I NDUFA9 subunit family protein [Piscinibacter sp.]|uniref:complex I NDUFA9 subunit family protein n=1 Tax=Piscinibacter sp. TaxID=1903157 RepID=UPI001B68911E|nr:complex I NDUFA9 subunit family protein [Piscinibacter sp.]MBK7532874.1 complex I NDUFA9 subunit family protein [Piscinibacter sp.]MBP6544253.1 complex I NDUFA9 subunit family protein [Piscinibacter sp.]
MDDILVLGGTGFVGRSVCEKLVERSGGAGGSIVVPTRHIAHARDLQMLPTLQPVQADVHDDAQLAQMVAGRDAVINLVAVLQGDERRFRHVHVDLPTRLARACQAAGVKRLVHVSALGVGANAPSHYLRSKAAGEAALAAAGLELTVLRPSVIFGAHDKLLNMFAALQGLAPFVPLAGADSRYQPVWVDDVAAAIVRCLDDPATIGKTYECTGPDVYTLRELVQAAGRWAGHERPVFGLPGGLAQLQARVMEMLPGEPLMSRDNLASMRVPNIATGTLPGLDALGIRATALSAIAPMYLGHGRGPARMDAWRARARRG